MKTATTLSFAITIMTIFCVTTALAQTVWIENFDGQLGKGITGGTPPVTNMTDITKWSIETTVPFNTNVQNFIVVSNSTIGLVLEANNVKDEVVWQSESIDISSNDFVELTVDLSEVGTLAQSDYVRTYYSVNGQPETMFHENGNISDDFTSAVAKQEAVTGTNLIIIIKADNGAKTSRHRFDNITVTAATPVSNQPPILVVDPSDTEKTVTVNTQISFNLIATEEYLDLADNITLKMTSGPAGSSFSETNGTSALTNSFTWTPDTPGNYSAIFEASDVDGTNSITININVIELDPGKVWINEFHYDNVGTDTNEGIEIAGYAGTSLANYEIPLYRENGTIYSTISLTGTIDDESDGFGAIWFGVPKNGIQNGPNGIALVSITGNTTNLHQFISYEGTFTATDGPAAGIESIDIGVKETTSTPLDYSLQLIGEGAAYADFTWIAPVIHSRGDLNANQTMNPPGAFIIIR